VPQGGEYDIFLSYARADSEFAEPLREALAARGLRIFFDESEIEDFAGITGRLTGALARSKALLALYSITYPRRRACQFELTAAFVAAQRAGDPRKRILVVNPEGDAAHIEPVELRDALFRPAATSSEGLADLAASVEQHVHRLDGVLGAVQPLVPPTWFGNRATGSTRFVGRLAAMWEIHSALHPEQERGLTAEARPGVAQVVGLGGIGKTLLAEEYGLRFGAAYPGGVFWLRGQGNDDASRTALHDADATVRDRELRALAVELGISLDAPVDPQAVEAAIANVIERRGLPCLWIVDDLPPGLATAEFKRWLAPRPLAKTLVTTRSRDYGALARSITPGLLDDWEAYALLTGRRAPSGPNEIREARALATELGNHALALDVAGGALLHYASATRFADFRAALADPSEDELELAAELADTLPAGHERSIAATLRRGIEWLGEEGLDVLRLASVLAVAPIRTSLVMNAFAEADRLDARAAHHRTLRASRQATSLSLAESDGDFLSVHTLVSRTVRFVVNTEHRSDALRTGAIQALTNELPTVPSATALAALAPDIAHARHLSHQARNELEAELLDRVANYDLVAGDYPAAELHARRRLQVLWERVGAEHERTADAAIHLSIILGGRGRLSESRELQRRALRTLRRTKGESSATVVMRLLADTLTKQGHFDRARVLIERATRAELAARPGDSAVEVLSLVSESQSARAAGNLGRARDLAEDALEKALDAYGGENQTTTVAKQQLAFVLNDCGEHASARRLQEAVVETLRRLLGGEDESTLGALRNLANILRDGGDLASARRVEEGLLEDQRRLIGSEHPNTLATMMNLAQTLSRLGELEEARHLQERALDGLRRVLGDDDPLTLGAMMNLANTLEQQGDSGRARQMRERIRQLTEAPR
jgi:tetratricopeptide (TPR) repeat protein